MKKGMVISVYFILTFYFLLSAGFAQWEPDVRLTYNDSDSWTSLNNAWNVAASGYTIHVVWSDKRNIGYEIYYKRSIDAGVNWSSDTRLTYSASSWLPSVAVSGSNVHVVWEDYRDNFLYSEIYYKRSTDSGTNWGTDTRLTNAPDSSWFPSVAVSGSSVHVVWTDYRDGKGEIYYKRSTDSGVNWSPDIRLTNSPSNLFRSAPSVSSEGSAVHVVWPDRQEIYYKRSTDGGVNWSSDTRLTYSASSWRPSVAVSNSFVHIVWWDFRHDTSEIYYIRSTDAGVTWGADTRLTNDSHLSESPSIAVLGRNIHVVWLDGLDFMYCQDCEIYYKRSTDAGANWEENVRLTNAVGASMLSSVAVSRSFVHVVLTDARDGNNEIYYKRNPTGNVGIEEKQIANLEFRIAKLKITPNPFTSFATIPGYEKENFLVYDISGRVVGIYKGERIGEDLSVGVYFVRPGTLGNRHQASKILRVVKVR